MYKSTTEVDMIGKNKSTIEVDMMDEGDPSSPVDSAKDDKSNWEDNMNKQFGIIENIVMSNINNQRKNIGKFTSQGKRLEQIIGIMSNGIPTWLRKNIKYFPQKQLEKEPLVKKGCS